MDNKQFLRERMLRNLIKESVLHSLAEQEEPVVSSTPPAVTAPSPETNQQSPTPLPTENPQQPVEFTVDEMIKKMNVIRGGKSFKDAQVYGALTGFFEGLSEEQKKLFEWFLNEISKVVDGQEDVNQPVNATTTAPEPSNQPSGPTPAPQASPAPAGPQAPLTPR